MTDKHTEQVQIIVNGKAVTLADKHATGREIKEAAIAQGVSIRPDFVLFEDLKNGQQRLIRDDMKVTVHAGDKFEAIPGDDNS